MYNYPGQGQYGQPPNYGAFPGGPGMGPPPAMGAPPGTGAAPGVGSQSQSPLPARPGGLPSSFQPPPNMPNINFNAPIIRLGMGAAPGKPDLGVPTPTSATRGPNADGLGGGRRGLGAGSDQRGMEQQRQQIRESMMALAPPTREEIMRTIFIGNITEGVGGDAGLESLLHAASGGKLRRWFRAQDADNKPCKFGFAEFEDAEGLETASEVLKGGVELPAKRVDAKRNTQNGNGESKDDEEEPQEVEKSTLLVVVDQESVKYAADWRSRRNEDPDAHQFRIDGAKENLQQVVATLFHPTHSSVDTEGDVSMQDTETRADPITGEVITIPINVEDELSDIPAAMRETVAAEIAAFRDRSNRRDLERLRREEELEGIERNRNGPRVSRLASPPLAAPSGPAGGANGIPLGPRSAQVQGAPSGPKGYTGVQLPKDYQNGVAFVNGASSAALSAWLGREDTDSDADDEELEKRRQDKKHAEEERVYLDYERRWLNRERQRTAAIEREKAREGGEDAEIARLKEQAKNRLHNFNDDEEAQRKTDLYYQDHSLWLRNRNAFRQREAAADEHDRMDEERERRQDALNARGAADSFLDRQATEIGARMEAQEQQREPARFKMNLGSAAAKAQQAAAPSKRRTVADVEGLLEDEEVEDTTARRTLVPIEFDPTSLDANRHLTDEERAAAVKQLAADIPTDKDGLWSWDVQWEYLDEGVVSEQLRPFVEKKIMELLGVQEEMLVDVVEQGVKKRMRAEELVEELEGALDEEAEVLVKKLWRMIIFYSESEKRGLST